MITFVYNKKHQSYRHLLIEKNKNIALGNKIRPAFADL
jgi:hypothetical protein